MTAAVGTDVGMEIDTGGRTGAGIGAGQSQAATVFPSSRGQSADWLSANHENSTSSVAGTESFRSRWQATLNAFVSGPIEGQTTGLSTRQATESGTGQGTAIGTRLGTGIEAENADAQADVSGEVSESVEATLPQGSKNSSAAVTPNADAVPRWMEASEQHGESAAGSTAAMPASAQSGVVGWRVAAPQVQSGVVVQNSDASGDARTGRSVKSDRRDSASQRSSTEAQVTANSNGTLATPSAMMANPAAPAPAMQAQILQANFAGSSRSILTDRALSPDREPATSADALTGSAATVRNGAAGAAGIAARSQINSRAATGNPMTATPGGSEDGKASRVPSLAPGDADAAAAKRLTGLPRATGTQDGETQLEPAASQYRTVIGNSLVETIKTRAVNSETYQGASLGVEGNSVFASQSSAATSVAEKPNPEGGRQSPEDATARMAHGDSAGDVSQPVMHAVLAQQAGGSVEASGMARVPAGAEGTANEMTAHAGVSAGAAGGTAAEETFAAMDAGTEVGTPGWIHAGGQTAEAGFQDPALGWVGVRADLSGGNVHAALMPGSTEAAQTLSGHLAGLNSYLAEQHTPVATLTMAAASSGGLETGAGQSMQQGAGQNPGQDAERNTTQGQSSLRPSTTTITTPAVRGTVTESGGLDGVAPMGEMRGRYISVMA